MPTDGIVGWDIGGAHIKAARIDMDGRIEQALQLPCPIWKGLDQLSLSLMHASSILGEARRHALTMTGELADLFPNRKEGVGAILDVVARCFPNCRIDVFAGESGFLDPAEARRHHALVASANWRATAALVASCLTDALLVDIGSTTTDLIPIADGEVTVRGTDDFNRLACDELIYFGVVRTPLMALSPRWCFDGVSTGICNEHFATTADVYRLTGDLSEGSDLYPSADNAPKTALASARRLARMIGRDVESAELAKWKELAIWLKSRHIELTQHAMRLVESRVRTNSEVPIVGAGAGAFLARQIAAIQDRDYVDFANLFGGPCSADAISTCAPAVAVGRLNLLR